MSTETKELKYTATPGKGEVSVLYAQPSGATSAYLLGHGAGTNMRHSFIQELSDALNDGRSYSSSVCRN